MIASKGVFIKNLLYFALVFIFNASISGHVVRKRMKKYFIKMFAECAKIKTWLRFAFGVFVICLEMLDAHNKK